MVARPFQSVMRGRKGRERWGVPPRGPGEVERPSKRDGRSWEALLKSRKGLGGLSKGAGKVGRPSWRAEKGRKAQQESG